MKENIKLQWITALRSGEYKQTQGALRINDGYCCLGVLCDLYAKEKKKRWRLREGTFFMHDNHDVLSKQVIKWAGVPTERGDFYIIEDHCYDSLAERNDAGADFHEIVRLIEKHF